MRRRRDKMNCYELEYKIISPIFVGYGCKLGIVNRTLYYVPGKTFWGAITSIISRETMGNKYDEKIYEKVGKFVRKHLIFSYFYPKVENKIFYPKYTERGIEFGHLNKEEFERRFITSYISTGINKDLKTAEKRSLHEFELITNKTSEGKNIKLAGYLFTDLDRNYGRSENGLTYFVNEVNNAKFKIQINGKMIDILQIIKNLQIGGERKYGFGKIELIKNRIEEKEISFYDSKIKMNLLEGFIEYDENLPLLSHLLLKEKNGVDYFQKIVHIKGDIEPFVAREWDKKGAGEKPKFEGIFASPGSKVKLMEGAKIKVGRYGFWVISN